MKKLIMLFLAAVLLAGCGEKTSADTATEEVPANYGVSIEIAKAEFEEIFAEFDGLEITETATMARSDDAGHIVVQITYTSDQGDGVYGFEFRKGEGEEPELLRQGEDVTIDVLMEE